MSNKNSDPTQNWGLAILSCVIILLIIMWNYKFIYNYEPPAVVTLKYLN